MPKSIAPISNQQPKSARFPGQSAALHIGLIILAGLACYANSLAVPFMFDDFTSIVVNPDISGGRPLLDILLHGGARRVADFSFAINYRLHGVQVAGYHVTNIAIHLAAAVTLYHLCAALLDSLKLTYDAGTATESATGMGMQRFLPLFAVLVFVCHPLQTQAVTYIVQRHTSLAALFYLFALLAYIKGRLNFEQHGFGAAVARWGLLFAASSLLAFHTKQIAYSLPLMLVMLEYSLFRGRLAKRTLLAAAVTGILLLAAILLPAAQNGSIADVMFDLRRAISEDIYFSRTSYFLTQTRVIVTYLRLLILPMGQNLDYDYPIFSSLKNIEVIAALLLHATLLTTAFVLQRRSHFHLTSGDRRHGLYQRLIVIGIVWFYIALSVESSFIPITDVIMEHRVYLPSAGFFIAVAAMVMLLGQKLHQGTRWRWQALTVICLTLSVLTIMRNHVWSDDVRFWQDVAAKSPRKARALSNLGWAHLNHDHFESALRLFVKAINLDLRESDYTWIMLNASLKGLKQYQGRFTTGEQYLTPAGSVDLRWYSQFNSVKFNNMGLASEFTGQPRQALDWYIESLNIKPDYDLALFNLGLLSARLGHNPQAQMALVNLKAVNPALAAKLAAMILR
jgi:hypothetical protein